MERVGNRDSLLPGVVAVPRQRGDNTSSGAYEAVGLTARIAVPSRDLARSVDSGGDGSLKVADAHARHAKDRDRAAGVNAHFFNSIPILLFSVLNG
jgi:hypothetical protein